MQKERCQWERRVRVTLSGALKLNLSISDFTFSLSQKQSAPCILFNPGLDSPVIGAAWSELSVKLLFSEGMPPNAPGQTIWGAEMSL